MTENGFSADMMLSVLGRLAEPLGGTLPTTSEVVVHDLRKMPNSIVAVSGNVTGRTVGDPATDLLLKYVVSGSLEDSFIGYRTLLPDGREMRSSTMIVRDTNGTPLAAICINTDLSAWKGVKAMIDRMVDPLLDEAPSSESIGNPSQAPLLVDNEDATGSPEVFVKDIDELADHLISQAIAEVGIPADQMKKSQKIKVVDRLKSKGLFMLRDSVETVASRLSVSRFTIYNYLNEIAANHPENTEESEESSGDSRRALRRAGR